MMGVLQTDHDTDLLVDHGLCITVLLGGGGNNVNVHSNVDSGSSHDSRVRGLNDSVHRGHVRGVWLGSTTSNVLRSSEARRSSSKKDLGELHDEKKKS